MPFEVVKRNYDDQLAIEREKKPSGGTRTNISALTEAYYWCLTRVD
jgi:hypothetical protein